MGAVVAAEGDRWLVTLVGAHGEHPPADESAWRSFAASLPVPDLEHLVTSATPLSGVVAYRFPMSQRRRYERLRRFPEGYVVVGDALCSFNPIYGQGMSVAALEARALDACLREGPAALPRRFFARVRPVVDVPWTIATGEDLRFPQVEGPRPPGFALGCAYLDRVQAAAAEDPVVCARFFEVLNLVAPPGALLSPRLAWRVLRRRPGRGGAAAHPRRRAATATAAGA